MNFKKRLISVLFVMGMFFTVFSIVTVPALAGGPKITQTQKSSNDRSGVYRVSESSKSISYQVHFPRGGGGSSEKLYNIGVFAKGTFEKNVPESRIESVILAHFASNK